MKGNILFLDYSVLPVSNNIILGNIDSAVSSGFKIIFLKLGQYFPWSMDTVIKSDFSYSEKLIDRISAVCKMNNIILVPVLSVLLDGDYILNDKKYASLIEYGYNNRGLDISACGINKLIEELVEDLFSLFINSEYLFFDLPLLAGKDKEWINKLDHFLERLKLYMKYQNKELIFGDNLNLKKILPNQIDNPLLDYYDNLGEKIEVFSGKTFSIYFNIYKIKLENIEYALYKLNIFCVLPSNFNFELLLIKSNKEIYQIDLEEFDKFFIKLESVWGIIRESREYLSILDRYPNNKYRIKFYRSIEKLKYLYIKLKKQSRITKDLLGKNYQTGFFTLWMDSRIDPVYMQLINLNLKARYIKEGC